MDNETSTSPEHDTLIAKPTLNGTRILQTTRSPARGDEPVYVDTDRRGPEVTEASGNMSSNYSIGSPGQYSGALVLTENGDENVPAVKVTNAVKCYGSKRILKSLNMTVKRGAVYSLLGASGCGKTTLLTCIVGIRHLSGGEISVFGSRTGTRESGVPGRRVGYMPQDIALYGVFTIEETLQYFGTLNGMSNNEIVVETGALVEFLDLPNQKRKVGTLSGGQKRRLSLAVALIHSPELIILDEPTVGVDPLLRESIWNHLIELVTVNQVTVIITTHYIDEARHSNMVGVMRDGKILSEKTPQQMYDMYETTFLEDIVLKLCHEDEMGGSKSNLKKSRTLTGIREAQKSQLAPSPYKRPLLPKYKPSFKRKACCSNLGEDIKSSLSRVKALVKKNITVTCRNYLFVIFLLAIPSLMMPLIMVVASGKPRDLKIAVVNLETNVTNCSQFVQSRSCDMDGFSCKFLDKLPKSSVQLSYYNKEDEARKEVVDGKQHAYMVFPDKFSEAVYFKMSADTTVTGAALSEGTMKVHIDESNPIVAPAVKQIISTTYSYLVMDLLGMCGFSPELAKLPYEFATPVYGGHESHTKEFASCGFLVSFIFFFGTLSSSVSLVWDKKQGTVERAHVSGVRTWEMLLAQLFTEFLLVTAQTLMAFTVLVVAYDTEVKGSIVLAIAILVVGGVMGNAHGFLWAAIANEEIEVVLLCMFSYFPTHFLSGLMWPTENFPEWVQWVAYFLPTTLPSETMRSIFFRGMDISYPQIYGGFIGAFVWICVLWTITTLIHARSAATR